MEKRERSGNQDHVAGRCHQIQKIFEYFDASFQLNDGSLELMGCMMKRDQEPQEKVNLDILDENKCKDLLGAVRNYSQRRLMEATLNQLDEAILENRETITTIQLTDVAPESLGLDLMRGAFSGPTYPLDTEFDEGMREGAVNLLSLIQGREPLLYYRQDILKLLATEEFRDENDLPYLMLPTNMKGVKVGYFYIEGDRTPCSIIVNVEHL